MYERGASRRREDALRVVAYRASASAARRCERDALSRARAVRVSSIAATGRRGVDRRRRRGNAATTTDALRFQVLKGRGLVGARRGSVRFRAFVEEFDGGSIRPRRARELCRRARTTMRATARAATASAVPPTRLADAAIAASARRRAVGLVDRCRSEGTDVRSPSDTHRRSRRRRRRPRRVFPGPRTLTPPRSPTSRSRRTGCSTASPRASPGSPSISTATRSSSRVGATPSCVPHADAHFSSRNAPRIATRVSPGSDGFPFLRVIPSSLCLIRNPKP